MKIVNRIIVLIIACCFLIFAILYARYNCPTSGIVIKKEYEPKHIYTTYVWKHKNGRSIPMLTEYPEKWYITIQNKNKKSIIYLPQDEWVSLKEGDYFQGKWGIKAYKKHQLPWDK